MTASIKPKASSVVLLPPGARLTTMPCARRRVHIDVIDVVAGLRNIFEVGQGTEQRTR